MSCPDEASLLLYAEKLDDSCRSHVESCDGCRATVRELETTIGEVRAAAPRANNHAVERLLRARPSSAGPRRMFLAAAAVILIVTGFGLYRLGVKPPLKAPTPVPVQPAAPERPPVKNDDGAMVDGALAWLAQNQKADGSFGDAGLTGLALLAFFGAGHGETSVYGPQVRSAFAFLLACQNEKGQFAMGKEPKLMYGNAIAAWALFDAVGGRHTADPRMRFAAEKSLAFLLDAQNPGKGWRYAPRCGDSDTSVTFWAGGALTAARRAGCDVPEAAFDGARAFIREVTDPTHLAVGYTFAGTGKVYVPGVNETYDHHQTLSAAAMALRLLAGDRRDESMAAAIGFLATDPPAAAKESSRDYYYWHLGTLGLFLHEGSGSPTWKEWEGRLLEALRLCREVDGTWSPNDRWGKVEGAGRVYATALNVLTLQTAVRFAAVRR